MKPARLMLGLLLGALALMPAACKRVKPPPPPASPRLGNLILKNLADEFPDQIQTAAYAGRVQLLVFLSPDDTPCRAAIADWNSLQQDYAPRGFTIVGVVADSRPASQLAQLTQRLEAGFPIGLADETTLAALGDPDAIHAIPTSFLLDRDGALTRAYYGFPPWPLLRDDIAAALEGLPLPSLAVEAEEE